MILVGPAVTARPGLHALIHGKIPASLRGRIGEFRVPRHMTLEQLRNMTPVKVMELKALSRTH